MIPEDAVYVAGHRGLVGSAIVRSLSKHGFRNLITATHSELDLASSMATDAFFAERQPAYVFLAAAKVGGILANATYPADFIRENLLIQTNVIDSAYRHGARKLLFLGSSCIYPRLAPQPIKEEYLLSGPLEPTNDAYALAKIAGIKMGQAYKKQYGFCVISAMPTNLYGPNDNFDLQNSHVLPALIRRFHDAKVAGLPSVTIWGSGSPKREFLHVDDLAEALVFLMTNYDGDDLVNVGVGEDITIKELSEIICEVVGYKGRIDFDSTKPDGTPRKLLDISKLSSMGWRPRIGLKEGIEGVYRWYVENEFACTCRCDS